MTKIYFLSSLVFSEKCIKVRLRIKTNSDSSASRHLNERKRVLPNYCNFSDHFNGKAVTEPSAFLTVNVDTDKNTSVQ